MVQLKRTSGLNTESSNDSGIVERLKKAVKDAGGPAEIARTTGIPLSTLNDYLKGNEVRFSRMAVLAKACKISLDWLASGTGSMDGTVSVESGQLETLFGGSLFQPANFLQLCYLLAVCQEYYQRRVQMVPTLKEVFEWIGPIYPTARLLADGQIEFKPSEGASDK